MHDERVLPRHQTVLDHELASRGQAPAAGAEGAVEDAAVLDFGQVDDAVGLDLDVVGVEAGLQDGGRLGREGRRAQAVEGTRPIDL